MIRRCRSKARPLLDQRAILGRRRAAAHVEALAAVSGGDVPVALHDPPLIALLEAKAIKLLRPYSVAGGADPAGHVQAQTTVLGYNVPSSSPLPVARTEVIVRTCAAPRRFVEPLTGSRCAPSCARCAAIVTSRSCAQVLQLRLDDVLAEDAQLRITR